MQTVGLGELRRFCEPVQQVRVYASTPSSPLKETENTVRASIKLW